MTLRQLARRLAAGDGVVHPHRPGRRAARRRHRHGDGRDQPRAALGLPGRPDSGYGTLTGQGNGQGGREHGQKCDQLPGYRKITDPDARAHVARVWGVDPDAIPGPGIPAVELLQSLGQPGGLRALLVHGSNLVVSAPNAGAVREGLASLDLLVVSDFFLSETAALADVVLPVPQWAEEEGTMTNLEGRVIRRRRRSTPPDGVRDELWILHELARRLDAPGAYSTDPRRCSTSSAWPPRAASPTTRASTTRMLDAGEAAHWPYPLGIARHPAAVRRPLRAPRRARPDRRRLRRAPRSSACPRPAS